MLNPLDELFSLHLKFAVAFTCFCRLPDFLPVQSAAGGLCRKAECDYSAEI